MRLQPRSWEALLGSSCRTELLERRHSWKSQALSIPRCSGIPRCQCHPALLALGTGAGPAAPSPTCWRCTL